MWGGTSHNWWRIAKQPSLDKHRQCPLMPNSTPNPHTTKKGVETARRRLWIFCQQGGKDAKHLHIDGIATLPGRKDLAIMMLGHHLHGGKSPFSIEKLAGHFVYSQRIRKKADFWRIFLSSKRMARLVFRPISFKKTLRLQSGPVANIGVGLPNTPLIAVVNPATHL